MSTAEENLEISAPEPVPPTEKAESTSTRGLLMLTLATVGFALNFWAWALLSPLGPSFKDALDSPRPHC
ncbi:hypothetical protein NMK54_10130 [Nocardia otitidiscaviarum]|uniref:hypothetical protein n=1 Tax=Nocardia otitidiscaviarum TaxID=1823 RepID=UPI001C8F2B93|nr:hypothetical protein [Nocardia otitidiscaviarum]MCP9620511.1 hypothetical protein [Nocardia otitidiscaviarum]